MSKQTAIARPYAKALFEIALQQRTISLWSELLQLTTFIIKQPEVQALLDSPHVTAQQCGDFLLKICQPKLTSESENFLKLLAQRDRLAIIPEITELFAVYRAEQEKLAKVRITSALPLNKDEQENLARKLKQRLQREVVLECRVDSSLIGGLIIQADDLVIDGSIRSKLTRLQTQLLS